MTMLKSYLKILQRRRRKAQEALCQPRLLASSTKRKILPHELSKRVMRQKKPLWRSLASHLCFRVSILLRYKLLWMPWKRKSVSRRKLLSRREKKVTVCILSDLVLCNAQKSSRVKQTPHSLKGMSQVTLSVN